MKSAAPSTDPNRPDGGAAARWFLPLGVALFAGSGCAALIYEIVWFQLLQLVIGASAISQGLLLATFMGGMCLGSLALARLLSPRRHPLRVYAVLELVIGAFGALAMYAIPAVGGVYTTHAGPGQSGVLLRGAICAVCLLPPTMLMGATLPAIARWVETTPRGMARLGLFYGGNTLGGVCGCLLAGFYLLRVHDIRVATYVAVAINVLVAAASLALAARVPYCQQANHPEPKKPGRSPATWSVYAAIGLSGASALGAEVIWTRLLSLVLGGTTYTFSLILALFLAGIGVGSSVGAVKARAILNPRLALAVCQLLLAAAVLWMALVVARAVPYLPLGSAASSSPWLRFATDLTWCAPVILPAAMLWGASFPLALVALAAAGQDGGRLVGRVYAANTVGAIAGALTFSLVCLPQLGTQQSQQLLVGLAILAALLMLASHAARVAHPGATYRPTKRSALWLAAVAGLGALLIVAVPSIPFELIAFGRVAPWNPVGLSELYRGEGMNSTVAVSENDHGMRSFHVSGRVEASSEIYDMRTQRMLGNLPAVLHPQPRSVLVVGFGAGVTAGSFLPYLSVNRLVICEIEPLIPQVVGHYFNDYNLDVLTDPAVEIVYDDARHFIQTTPEKFDIITSDPIHPWIKGAATLYTREYFEHVKARLNPGGVVTQWVPLYESNPDAVKSELATFFEVFPHGTVWTNARDRIRYDLVLVGTVEPPKIDLDAVEERMQRDDHRFVVQMLRQVNFDSGLGLLSTFAGRASDLAPWFKDAEINRDDNLRLQYLAGMTPGATDFERIHQEIVSHGRFTDDIFSGSEERQQRLKDALAPSARP